ncbi:MAG TPA: sigma-70 family RNA polymerase sigma factor [Sandaracinaceae bacterium LLY-WYZ-13_1]|nr:sigma-70 family RNA polymerase sigma factor [Sandaracinaceae bacterium LLY-WYZ-13_1]
MEAAFEEVFLQEHAYVARTLLRLGVGQRDLEDAMQEVFLTVHRKWADYDASRPVRPWLFAFAVRHAANYRRLRRHDQDWDAHPESFAGADDPERSVQRSQARAIVLRALGSLSDDRRAVFVACELDGLPAPEVAEVLAIPVGTVRSRLRTARAEFTNAARRLMADEREVG